MGHWQYGCIGIHVYCVEFDIEALYVHFHEGSVHGGDYAVQQQVYCLQICDWSANISFVVDIITDDCYLCSVNVFLVLFDFTHNNSISNVFMPLLKYVVGVD